MHDRVIQSFSAQKILVSKKSGSLDCW